MKNKFRLLPVVLFVLAIVLLSACGTAGTEEPKKTGGLTVVTDKPGTKTEAPAATDVPPTAAPTEPPTKAPPTEAPTPDNRPLPEDGTMIYYEDFSSYGDVSETMATVKALGWKLLNKSDGAPSDWTASLAIKDGALVVDNYWETEDATDNDSYVLMLDDAYMDRALKTGSYTLQYDVTYTSSRNFKRYIVIITEYDSEGYNSYHFRIAGYGNSQVHYQDTWFTYDHNDEGVDLYAARKNTNEKGTTIAYKLLGIEGEIDNNENIDNFKDVTVTIRIVRENGLPTIYMKTAEMAEFIKVSQPSANGNAQNVYQLLKGKAVCLKPGNGIVGTVDNIAIWTGTGEMPADHTVTYEP